MTERATHKAFTGWHALVWFLCFFGLMFAVNGVFLYQAITSFPGEDTPKSYLQGLNYNSVLAARAAQSDLEWRAEIGLDAGELVVRLQDRDGHPVRGRVVRATLRRPATTNHDLSVELLPSVSGEYRGSVSPLGTGEWQASVSVFAQGSETTEFVADKSLIAR